MKLLTLPAIWIVIAAFSCAAGADSRIRTLPPSIGFEAAQSSVISSWLPAGEYSELSTKDLALTFTAGAGRPYSIDVFTQGRLYTLHSLERLAYFAPSHAQLLLRGIDTVQVPKAYSGNMFTYPLDVAALELESLFRQVFNIESSPELKEFILSLFTKKFMGLALEELNRKLLAVLSHKSAGADSSRGMPVDTLGQVEAFINASLAAIPNVNMNLYSGDSTTPIGTVTYHAKKLTVDFSKYTCFENNGYADWSSREIKRTFNHSLPAAYRTFATLDRNDTVKFHFDLRSEQHPGSGSQQAMDAYYAQLRAGESFGAVVERLRNSAVAFPLPVSTSGDIPVSNQSDGSGWKVKACFEKIAAAGGEPEHIVLRYQLVQVHDLNAVNAMSDDEVRDVKMREVLHSIHAQIRHINSQQVQHLSRYIQLGQSPRLEDAEREVREIGPLAAAGANAKSYPAVYRMAHAKRGNGNHTPTETYNAIGFEVDIRVLTFEGKW